MGKCPESFEYLWGWFHELRGGEALTFTEIRNWSDLTRKNVRPWEVETLTRLDSLFWSTINER